MAAQLFFIPTPPMEERCCLVGHLLLLAMVTMAVLIVVDVIVPIDSLLLRRRQDRFHDAITACRASRRMDVRVEGIDGGKPDAAGEARNTGDELPVVVWGRGFVCVGFIHGCGLTRDRKRVCERRSTRPICTTTGRDWRSYMMLLLKAVGR